MNQIVIQNSLLTVARRIALTTDQINEWSESNTYITIGVESAYASNNTLVPIPNQSLDYINEIYRSMIAIKKINVNDMAYVIPRIDWQTGVVYSPWDNQIDMYSTVEFTPLTGTVNVNNSRTVTGTNTVFELQLQAGDLIYLPGDDQYVAPQTLQVTDIFSNTSLNVNTAFVGDFISNTAYSLSSNYPDYVNNFYVRNSYDQVFVCLFNNGGVASNSMPALSLGGNLPQNPYIVTSDGYKWKYMYTIYGNQKERFFTTDWMPVYSDPVVVASAVNGRIDIILIEEEGSGYNQNVASNNADILQIVGDGTGANVTAVVDANGSIIGINILDGGENYTTANVVITSSTGTGANLRVVIGPPGGHGFNPVDELGATSLMLSSDLSGTENGTIPVGPSVGTGQFEYHQIGILTNPILAGSGNIASNDNYSMVSTVSIQPPGGGKYFTIGETVYQGSSLANATFSGVVVYWDDVNNILWLNNLAGEFIPQSPIVGTIQTSPVTAFILTPSMIAPFTGDLLYVNNILPIIRGQNQTEQIQIIFNF